MWPWQTWRTLFSQRYFSCLDVFAKKCVLQIIYYLSFVTSVTIFSICCLKASSHICKTLHFYFTNFQRVFYYYNSVCFKIYNIISRFPTKFNNLLWTLIYNFIVGSTKIFTYLIIWMVYIYDYSMSNKHYRLKYFKTTNVP